jgi:hypothetical protein
MSSKNDHSDVSAVLERAQEVEVERMRKQQEREEKKLAKIRKKKQELMERLIAPILLILTLIISGAIYLISQY